MELTASSLMAWWGGLAPTPNRSKTPATGQSLRDLTPNGPLQKHYLGTFGESQGFPCCALQREELMTDAVDGVRDLEAWLAPFLTATGRKTRRTWAPLYLRGLLGPGERKSLQPMATRLGLSGHDQLQHFIASPAWNDGPLWTELAREADRLVGGCKASLVIDDTALPRRARCRWVSRDSTAAS